MDSSVTSASYLERILEELEEQKYEQIEPSDGHNGAIDKAKEIVTRTMAEIKIND